MSFYNAFDDIETVSIESKGADPTGMQDSTAAVNAALATGKVVVAGPGVFLIDPDVGIKLPAGASLIGSGMMRTIFKSMPKGATQAELANYVKGSVIKRANFTFGVANSYNTGGHLSDFSVLLNHPAFDLANYRQIGVDLRNMTRWNVERVNSGNITIPGSIVDVNPGKPNSLQGYGFVCGTRGSSDPDYCGGEANTLRDCFSWGAYINISVDENQICGATSAAHATIIENPDIQTGHLLLVQSTQYAAGVVFRDVLMQDTARQPGNAASTVGCLMAGYGCQASIKYAEMGSACDVLGGFTSSAKDSSMSFGYFSYVSPSAGAIQNLGSRNYLRYQTPVDQGGGVFTNDGQLNEYFAKGRTTVRCKFRWNGSSMDLVDSYGVSNVVRNAIGDYTIQLANNMPSVGWVPSFAADTNASLNPGVFAISDASHSASGTRVLCFAQNAGVTTSIDPRWVYFFGSQQ